MRVGQSRKRDANEPEIVAALEQAGVKVYRISGSGLPDLLCEHRGRWLPLEVKSERGKLTTAQAVAFLASPFAIVRTKEQALRYFGIKA